MNDPANTHDATSPCVIAACIVQSPGGPQPRRARRRRCRARRSRPRAAASGESNALVVSRLTWPLSGECAEEGGDALRRRRGSVSPQVAATPSSIDAVRSRAEHSGLVHRVAQHAAPDVTQAATRCRSGRGRLGAVGRPRPGVPAGTKPAARTLLRPPARPKGREHRRVRGDVTRRDLDNQAVGDGEAGPVDADEVVTRGKRRQRARPVGVGHRGHRASAHGRHDGSRHRDAVHVAHHAAIDPASTATASAGAPAAAWQSGGGRNCLRLRRHTWPARPTTAAATTTLSCVVMRCTRGRAPRSSARSSDRSSRDDREGQVALERLVRRLVCQLDVEPVLSLGEARERHRKAARQLVSRRQVELRRQRLAR